MSAKRRKKNRSGAVGLLFLELIGVAAFALLLTTARSERQAAVEHDPAQPAAMNMAPVTSAFGNYQGQSYLGGNNQIGNNQIGNNPVQQESTGWNQHRPQFSEVMGNIWEAGF